MMARFYECYDTGKIIDKDYECPAQFSIVKKYSVIYKEELPRFQKNPLNIYALPFSEVPEKVYNGLDRMGPGIFDKMKRSLTKEQREIVNIIKESWSAEELMLDEEKAKLYLSLFRRSDDYELIWTRISGSNDPVPEGYQFIGYDIAYPPSCSGAFSIVCDCMFICRWHGCDEEGTLFIDDFNRLNHYGLFDVWQDAYNYLAKYIREDWTERGEFGIFEVYMK